MRSHYLTIISCMAAGLLSSCAEPSLSKGAAAMPSLRFLAIGENSDFSAPTKAVEIASSDVAGRELSVTIDTTNFAMNSQGTWHVIVEELLSEGADQDTRNSQISEYCQASRAAIDVPSSKGGTCRGQVVGNTHSYNINLAAGVYDISAHLVKGENVAYDPPVIVTQRIGVSSTKPLKVYAAHEAAVRQAVIDVANFSGDDTVADAVVLDSNDPNDVCSASGNCATDDSGYWDTGFITEIKKNSLLITAKTGQYTRTNGAEVTLVAPQQMQSLLKTTGDKTAIVVTPLTQMLVKAATALATDDTLDVSHEQAVSHVVRDAMDTFGFDITAVSPTSAVSASTESKKYQLLLDGLSDLVLPDKTAAFDAFRDDISNTNGRTLFDLAVAAATDMADGTLDGKYANVAITVTEGGRALPQLTDTRLESFFSQVNTANGDAELYAVDTPLVLGKASYEAQFKRFGSDGLLTLTATDRNCVRDTHNNVFWEVKADDSSSLRSGAHKYTWFLETTDGLTGTSDSQALPVNSQGVKGSGVPCGNTLTSCNIQDYINEVNVVNLCGKNRWRLPTIEELSSLFVPVSGINTAYFPNTVRESALDSYWSSTEASDAGNAHGISFGANQVFAVPGSAPKTFPGLIRLVHDGLD